MRTIAIIGAGFSGTATAVHLLRRARSPVRIVLIDDQPEIAAGLAYAPGHGDCLLNVPAGQMSLDASSPDELVDFALRQGMQIGPQEFLSRALYGRYLCESLQRARASSGMECTRVWGRVARLAQFHNRARSWRIDLEDGHLILADEVVLAIGNPRPSRLPALQAIRGTSWYVHDPWGEWPQETLQTAPRRVLLLGTGLTMADVALRLALRGSEPPEILALSRRGRLPQAQTEFNRASLLTDAVATLRGSAGSLRSLVSVVHGLSHQLNGVGGDWREVINAVRKIAPELWAALNAEDRRRFLRHVRPVWDVHRHRLPPVAAQELQRLQAAGRLTVQAGSIESAEVTRGGIEVAWRRRGTQQRERATFGRLFNCTGPDYNPARSGNPLVQSLLAKGLIAVDPLELGIQVATDGEVVSADGRIVKGLYYIGPWLRARDWEATAVPELREHARRLAERLAGSVANGWWRQPSQSAAWTLAERAATH